MFVRPWVLGLCACSVFPERAVLPDENAAGLSAGSGGSHSGGSHAGLGGYVAGSAQAGTSAGGSGGEPGDGGAPTLAGSGNVSGGSGGTGGDAGADAGAGGELAGASGASAGSGGGAPCPEPVVTRTIADADTWLSEAEPKSNFGSQSTLVISGVAGEQAYGLVRFDPKPLDPSVTVVEARIELELRTVSEARTLGLHRVLTGWQERQADWRRIADAFAPTASAYADVPADASRGTLVAFHLEGDVLSELYDASARFDWLIKDEEAGASRIEVGARELGADTPALVVVTCP